MFQGTKRGMAEKQSTDGGGGSPNLISNLVMKSSYQKRGMKSKVCPSCVPR